MLSRIVTTKLKESRRLVIPDLGAFIVREDGRIIFSELLRTDDGMLRAAVVAERGVDETEAARMVERFVADIRYTLNHGMIYRLEGLGVLTLDERDLTVFESRRDEQQRFARGSIGRILAESADTPAAAEPAKEPQPQQTETQTTTEQQPTQQRPAPQRRPRPKQPQKAGTDIFLVVAIVIALVAISVIGYGLWVSSNRDDFPTTGIYAPSESADNGADNGSADDEVSDIVDLSIPSGK